MNNPLIERVQQAGWKEQRTLYHWQHTDGRQIERGNDGKWRLIPLKGKPRNLGTSMKVAFEMILNG